MGAPVGNQNAAKAKRWQAAIEAAVARRVSDGRLKGLEDLADKLIDAVLVGDLSALKEFGDRYDGKPTQQTEISGPDGGDIPHSLTVEFVNAGTVPR